MKINRWFSQLSVKQRFWLFGTVAIMVIIVCAGILLHKPGTLKDLVSFNVEMSIRDIALKLNVTGKALARELKLPLDISKQKPLRVLGITPENLQHVTEHLISHRDTMLKYYVYLALVIGALFFLLGWGGQMGLI